MSTSTGDVVTNPADQTLTVCNHCGDKALDGVDTCERHTDYRHPAVQTHRRAQGQAAVIRNTAAANAWLGHRSVHRPDRAALGVYRVQVTDEGVQMHMVGMSNLLALAYELDRPVEVTWKESRGRDGFLDLSVRWTDRGVEFRAWDHAEGGVLARRKFERAQGFELIPNQTYGRHWHPVAEALDVPVTWIEG